jgi:hypothetical protein
MKIKGTVISARKEFIKEHFGEDAWEKVMKTLPSSHQDQLRGNILSSTWYSFEIGKALDNAIVKVLGGGNLSYFEELGAVSARKSLAKEHKSFLTKGDPQGFLKKAGIIYKFYYSTGYREYKETGPQSGIMTTFESETYSAPDCLTVIGWHKEALKLCGAKQVNVVEEECRTKGGKCCRYRFQWTM